MCSASCCHRFPISPPLPCPLVPSQEHGEDELGEDDAVSKDLVALGDPIIGEDVLLVPDRGPGAIPPLTLPTPKGMTPAAWAKHCVTHLPYDPACPFLSCMPQGK